MLVNHHQHPQHHPQCVSRFDSPISPSISLSIAFRLFWANHANSNTHTHTHTHTHSDRHIITTLHYDKAWLLTLSHTIRPKKCCRWCWFEFHLPQPSPFFPSSVARNTPCQTIRTAAVAVQLILKRREDERERRNELNEEYDGISDVILFKRSQTFPPPQTPFKMLIDTQLNSFNFCFSTQTKCG